MHEKAGLPAVARGSGRSAFAQGYGARSSLRSALRFKRRLERVKGIEPFTENAQAPQGKVNPDSDLGAHTQIRAQMADALGRDLSQVVAAWSELPASLKAAILAIVNSSTAAVEDES